MRLHISLGAALLVLATSGIAGEREVRSESGRSDNRADACTIAKQQLERSAGLSHRLVSLGNCDCSKTTTNFVIEKDHWACTVSGTFERKD